MSLSEIIEKLVDESLQRFSSKEFSRFDAIALNTDMREYLKNE